MPEYKGPAKPIPLSGDDNKHNDLVWWILGATFVAAILTVISDVFFWNP